MSDDEILLEAGTNEIEVLELILGSQSYGINVLKTRFIMEYDPSAITEVPDSFHSVLGTIWFQNESIPVVDLKIHLGKTGEAASADRIIIVCEFNKLVTGFLVDNVKEIHRISWENIKPPSPIVTSHETKVTGMAVIENKEMVMLDFEGIIGDIIGDLTLLMSGKKEVDEKPELAPSRGEIKMMIADDSRVIRQQIEHKLNEANYTTITQFDNGKALFDAILNTHERAFNEGKDITDYLIIVITDIEMPGMDGLTLCKKVKERFPRIKVMILSSLISKEMSYKCQAVNADGYLSKKDLNQLVSRIDELCF